MKKENIDWEAFRNSFIDYRNTNNRLGGDIDYNAISNSFYGATGYRGTDYNKDFDGDIYPIQQPKVHFIRNFIKVMLSEPITPKTCFKELPIDLINHINYIDRNHNASGYIYHTLCTTKDGNSILIVYGDNDDIIAFRHTNPVGGLVHCIVVNFNYLVEEMPYSDYMKLTMKIFDHLILFENGYRGMELDCIRYIPYIMAYDLMLQRANTSTDMDKKFKEVGLYDELCKLDKGKDLYDVLITFIHPYQAINELIELSGIYKVLL